MSKQTLTAPAVGRTIKVFFCFFPICYRKFSLCFFDVSIRKKNTIISALPTINLSANLTCTLTSNSRAFSHCKSQVLLHRFVGDLRCLFLKFNRKMLQTLRLPSQKYISSVFISSDGKLIGSVDELRGKICYFLRWKIFNDTHLFRKKNCVKLIIREDDDFSGSKAIIDAN